MTSAACLCAVVLRTTLADPVPDRQQDADREPAEVIAFAGIASGDKVADFLPVTPYFAKIFCRAVGDAGHVYVISVPRAADMPTDTPPALSPDEACTNVTSEVLRSRNYPAPELHSDSDDPGWVYEYFARRLPVESFVAPEPLDMIWISESYHALHNPDFGSPNIRLVGTAMLSALKPGGILLIVDHVATHGSGARDTGKLHRIEPEQVRREMIAAGFEYVGQSDVLHRAEDPHTTDAYRVHGTADRFLLKFRRP